MNFAFTRSEIFCLLLSRKFRRIGKFKNDDNSNPQNYFQVMIIVAVLGAALIGFSLGDFGYSTAKLGIKGQERIKDFTEFVSKVFKNEIGGVGKVEQLVESAETGVVKLEKYVVNLSSGKNVRI